MTRFADGHMREIPRKLRRLEIRCYDRSRRGQLVAIVYGVPTWYLRAAAQPGQPQPDNGPWWVRCHDHAAGHVIDPARIALQLDLTRLGTPRVVDVRAVLTPSGDLLR